MLDKIPTIMIFGLGNLGTHLLNMLANTYNNNVNIVVTGRNEDSLLRKTNMAKLIASQHGMYPNIKYEVLDLLNIEKTAELIHKHNPFIIFNSSSIQSWRKILELPNNEFKKLSEAALGPWAVMHLPLMNNIQKAKHMSGVQSFVINAAFPDVVNPWLSKKRMAPDLGIGNVANAIPAIRVSFSYNCNIPMQFTEVKLIAHHFVSHFISRHGLPDSGLFAISASYGDINLIDKIDIKKVFQDIPNKFKRMVGNEGQPMTAASAYKVIMAILYNSQELLHTPGPLGLEGGYPVRVKSGQIELDLPQRLSLADARNINRKAQILEGIEEIHDNGTITFSKKNMLIMKETLSYYHDKLDINDAYEAAIELKNKYNSYASKYI